MKKLSSEIIKIMREGTREERLYICQKHFIYFCIYYFPEYFVYPLAPFHFEMFKDLDELALGNFAQLMWVIYRESAKTTFAKMFEVYCICFSLRHYMCIDSYDKENAEASTFDIAVILQTNHMLIKDFGQLFNETRSANEKKMKKISSFITANDIKVEALSTQESVRGKVYKSFRPDYLRLDDFETDKTRLSPPVTQKIMAHIKEFKSGLSPDKWVLYLCNLITEAGNVYALMEEQRDNPEYRIRQVNVEMDGEITWPAKYVRTNDEAAAFNKNISDKSRYKVSLEAKLKDLGAKAYAENMMNSPQEAGDLEFDRDIIDELILKAKQPKRKRSDWLFWNDYNASHRYAMGGDTSAGVGRDSNAAVVIDFSTLPARQVASYANNRIAPHMFAHEMKNVGNDYGGCLLIPELNNTGYATVTELRRIYDTDKLWHKRKSSQIITNQSHELGWKTDSANRYELIVQFKKAVLDGKLIILDKRILEECRRFSKADVENMGKNTAGLATRHFDLLFAAALAWVGRDFAEPAVNPDKDYTQPAFEVDDFESSSKGGTMLDKLRGVVESSSSDNENYEQGVYETDF